MLRKNNEKNYFQLSLSTKKVNKWLTNKKKLKFYIYNSLIFYNIKSRPKDEIIKTLGKHIFG